MAAEATEKQLLALAAAGKSLAEISLELRSSEFETASLVIQMLQVLCTNKFVLITGTSVLVATVFHKPMSVINGPEELGTLMLYLFLFCIGLPADLKMVLVQAALFFVFCAIIASVNLGWTLVWGKVLRFNLEELLLAVNANLGGAPSGEVAGKVARVALGIPLPAPKDLPVTDEEAARYLGTWDLGGQGVGEVTRDGTRLVLTAGSQTIPLQHQGNGVFIPVGLGEVRANDRCAAAVAISAAGGSSPRACPLRAARHRLDLSFCLSWK